MQMGGGGVYFADAFSPVQTSFSSSFTAVYLLFTLSVAVFVLSSTIKKCSLVSLYFAEIM